MKTRISAIAIVSLACGIGLNILIFCFTSPVLVKGLPYPDSDRLLDVSMAPPGRPEARGPLTPALYFLLRDKTSAAFEAIGVFDAGRAANVAGDAGGALAERVAGHRISATGLAALGTAPLHGRLPAAADEASTAPPTMVLGYPLWQERFGGRADVVNQTVSVDGQPTTILGVMPEGFGLLDNFSDAWFTSSFEPAPGQETQKTLRGVGRLKPGATMAEAQAAVKVALDEYALQFPNRDKGWTVELTPWTEARFGGIRRPLMMAQLAVGAMLLLLCVSLAVLVSARTPVGERRPSGVLSRGLTWAFGGGAIGLVLVWLALPTLLELTPGALPRLGDVALDATVVAFAVVLSLVAGLAIGTVPAMRVSRAAPSKPGFMGQLGAMGLMVLVAVQMTLAFVLVVAGTLAYRAYGDLRGRDVGIDTAGLLAFDAHLPRSPYVMPNVAKAGSIDLSEYSPAGAALFDRIRTAVQSTPGVVQAAGVGTQPFASAPFVQAFAGDVERTPDNQINVQYLAVTENYFNTMGIRLVVGRDFAETDQPDSPWVVIVNETLAKQQWPDSDAVGQRLALTFHPDDGEAQREVIGVVADVLPFKGASEVPPLIYLLHRQQSPQQRASLEGRRTVMSFLARTSGDPLALEDAVRPLVGKVDLATPVTAIRTVESYANAGQTVLFEYIAKLLGLFALVAVVIALAGTFSLSVFGVTLGSSSASRLLRALVALVIAAAVGRMVWLRLAAVLESFLTNLTVTPSDPMLLVVAGGVLAAATVIAVLAAPNGVSTAGR